MRISDWSSDVCSSDLMDDVAGIWRIALVHDVFPLRWQVLVAGCAKIYFGMYVLRFDTVQQLPKQILFGAYGLYHYRSALEPKFHDVDRAELQRFQQIGRSESGERVVQ